MVEQTRPQGEILKVLKGDVAEHHDVSSKKPGKEGVLPSVSLVENGAGMVGLEKADDNREWAGIFNHVLKTARVATFLAERLKKIGVEVDPGVVLNTILVSHSGRRQWDEARWYPDEVDDSSEKVKKGDTNISLGLLNGAGVSPIIIENVSAHDPFSKGRPDSTLDTWEKKLALYADFRTSQDITSLKQRFDDLQRAVEQGRITQNQLDQLREWGNRVEGEIFSHFEIESVGKLLEPEDIKNDYPKQPTWEKYIRKLYIQDAEQGIFDKLDDFEKRILAAPDDVEADKIADEVAKEFFDQSWWGRYIRDIYVQRQKPDMATDEQGNKGMARAIAFFSALDVGQIYKDTLYKRLEDN